MRPTPIGLAVLCLLLATLTSAAELPSNAPSPGSQETFVLPPATVPSLPPPSSTLEKYRVERIVIKGNKSLDSSELEKLAQPYQERELTEVDIETLRLELTKAYVDQGFVNSGVVLATNNPLDNGVLTFKVIEGRLKDIRIRGTADLQEAYVTDRLQGDAEETLNINVLRERFQMLLDNPLFVRVNSRLLPGSQLGEAILDLDVERARPYQMSIAANNYRPPSIGEKGLNFNGVLRNLSGRGDALDLAFSLSPNSNSGENIDLNWRVPINRFDTQLSFRVLHGLSMVVEEPLASLDIRSIIDRQEIGVSQPIFASLRQRLNMGLTFAKEQNNTTLGDIPFSFVAGSTLGETRAHLWKFWQEYNTKSESDYLGLRSTFAYASLSGAGGATKAVGQPDRQYFFWLGQGQYLRKLTEEGAQLVARATVQLTDAYLSSLHDFAIGGVNSVRGYRENSLLRSNGQVVNFDITTPIAMRGEYIPNLTVGAFFDWGRGYNKGEDKVMLSSVGISLKATWKGVRGDLVLAKKIAHSEQVGNGSGSWQDKGIHAQIAYDY